MRCLLAEDRDRYSHILLMLALVRFFLKIDFWPIASGEPMLTRTARQRRGGFSLIELLIVMAIMISLAGMGMGGYQRVRATAAKISCTNNLRQIGLGLTAYVDGPGQGLFPDLAPLPSQNASGRQTLRTLLGDKNDATGTMFHCPSDPTYFPKEGQSYQYNTSVATKMFGAPNKRNTGIDKIKLAYDYVPVHYGMALVVYADGHVSN
jgi:prepilin-type N-terminal cleavage/methylation domain-containing protein/prepilin-type processing-associated H-X9-DG protein